MKKRDSGVSSNATPNSGSLAAREVVPVLAVPELPPVHFSLQDATAVFRAHWWLFFGTLLLVLGIGFVVALLMPSFYESTAIIDLEDRAPFSDTEKAFGGEIPGLSRDAALLESMPLAIRVLTRLRKERLLPATEPRQGASIASIPASMIDRFREHLRVEHAPDSSVYTISYRDTDPRRAARVVNLVVETFRKMRRELLGKRYDSVRRSIRQEAARLRVAVRKAEEKVVEFKKSHDLLDGIGISLKIQQIGDLNAELRRLRSDLRDAEARRKRVSAMSRVGNVAALLNTARNDVRSLRSRIADLRGDIDRLEKEVSQGQEAMVTLRDLQRDAESGRKVLEKLLVAEKQHGMSVRNQIVLSNPVTVISKGFVPVEPIFPTRWHIMALSLLAAPLLATMLVLFAERFNSRLRRQKLQAWREAAAAERKERLKADASDGVDDNDAPAESVRHIGGSGVADTVPHPVIPIPGDGATIVPATEVLGKMQSRFSQAIAHLNGLLRSRLGGRGPFVTVVTSVGKPGDKVSVAAALAALNAAEGKKVVLVDLSLGEAELHRAFMLEPSPGMTDVLRKKRSLLKAFQTDFRTHVSLFARGAPASDEEIAQLLDAAPALLTLLKRYFDQVYVVVRDIDHASRSQLLVDEADQVLLVMEQKDGDHIKLTSLLLRSTLAAVRDRTLPVYVARQGL